MYIKTLDNLYLTKDGLHALEKGKSNSSLIGLRQGDLDGACGPYALMMALIAHNAISRNDAINIWCDTIDGRTKFAKAIKNSDVLFKNGTENKDLVNLFNAIKEYFPTRHPNLKKLNAREIDVSGKNLIPLIIEQINNSLPIIIGLDWKGGGGHWVTVVGYQKFNENSKTLEKILVLDPQNNQSSISPWNGVLDIHNSGKGKKPYEYWVEGNIGSCSISAGIQFTTS